MTQKLNFFSESNTNANTLKYLPTVTFCLNPRPVMYEQTHIEHDDCREGTQLFNDKNYSCLSTGHHPPEDGRLKRAEQSSQFWFHPPSKVFHKVFPLWKSMLFDTWQGFVCLLKSLCSTLCTGTCSWRFQNMLV